LNLKIDFASRLDHDVDVIAAAARSSLGGVDVFAAGVTMAALGRGSLASADRNSYVSAFDVSEGLGDRALVAASEVGVVPGVVSQGAGGFSRGLWS